MVLRDHKTACVPNKSLFWKVGFCFPSGTVFLLGPPPLLPAAGNLTALPRLEEGGDG